MAHDLYVRENGQAAMFSAREVPWHGLGKVLDGPATSAEAIKAAGLDWRVRKVPLWAAEGIIQERVGDRFAIVPEDRWGKQGCPVFGVVGQNYTPLQNAQAFAFFDSIVGMKAAMYHTAGALDEGRRVWILAKLPDVMRVVRDDVSDKYLLLANGHDGSTAVQMKFTPVRVVCQNTLSLALSGGAVVSVHHGAGFWRRMSTASEALGLIKTTFTTLELKLRQMTMTDLTGDSLKRYLGAVFPMPEQGTEALRRVARREREHCVMLFEMGLGNDLPGVRGTLYAAFNAVTEYVDHYRGRMLMDERLNSIWFGQGAQVKSRAYRLAAEPRWLSQER